MKPQDLQNKYLREAQEHHINGQGEPDIDYVIWLENNLIQYINQNKELIEICTKFEELRKWQMI